MPAAFIVALWRRGDRHGATVPLWSLGQNCWNVSVYIRDARAQELPLVGGGEHDWAMLLGQAGWLEHDQGIGRAVWLVGVVLYGASVLLGWRFLSSGRRSAGAGTSPIYSPASRRNRGSFRSGSNAGSNRSQPGET